MSNTKKMTQIVKNDIDEEILRAEKQNVEVPDQYHQEMLSFIRNLEREEATVVVDIKRKNKKPWLRVASIVMITFIGFNTVAVTASAAYRQRVFTLFKTSDGKGATLFSEDEKSLLEGWNNYWYPERIPQNYQLKAAERREEQDLFLFQSVETGESIRIFVTPEEYESNFDVEYLHWEPMEIGLYDGYFMVDNEFDVKYGVCLLEQNICSVQWSGECEKEDMEHLMKSMKYQK
ncbi:MAG: hypothetical protein IKT25_09065 [Firmicutes bacterium]|nr:hypothetical protein [Bacillota bacterium]